MKDSKRLPFFSGWRFPEGRLGSFSSERLAGLVWAVGGARCPLLSAEVDFIDAISLADPGGLGRRGRIGEWFQNLVHKKKVGENSTGKDSSGPYSFL